MLGQQQVRVIDVTENVFTSLLNDLQVAQSIRPWLEQLAVPIMKMALVDESLFTDKDHVVRDVINKLAELEVLASAEDAEEQAAVRQAFSWIINLVNKEFDGTTNVYQRAAQQLDLLINVQKSSFERNIKQVIAEAIQEEKSKATAETGSPETEDEENQWLRMTRRLQENHWILFDADTDDAKRLKVAWIAPRKGKYVFVNVMGRKDRIATDIELAELFKTGAAVVLDGTDDPAMDRAQYTMLQKLHQQLLFQSSHDELTGLINRREFLTCMQHAAEDARQSKNKHAICYIDIDNFKVINTNYGYEAGDKLLLDIMELIKKNIAEDNVLARIGADQFSLLLQRTSMDDAVELVEDIMDQLVDYRFEWDDNRMSVTASTGIAIVNASTDNAEQLLQTAESSCGLAKESGGNQVQIASAGSNRLSRRKRDMEWATKIDKALDENALFLRCQKIQPIQPHLGELPHYEILLGISEELGGNASLGDFIQAAEQHNRMIAVDRWVIRNSFEWLARNEDVVSDVAAFSINLSGQSLNNEQLIEYIYEQVARTSVPIEKVCFEVTETTGVSNLSDTSDFIQTIKGTGCKFSLDDFGTGMSSYSYLKNLPVDYLKIDGIFIKDILNNQNDYAVVKSVTEIGHFMDKLVVAEFVQDEESAELLKEIGVDYLQGFGISRPHKLDDLLQ
jgi:diguanylate cyclase (GGDEF)-like protein